MQFELISDRAAFERLAQPWDALLAQDCTPPLGMDATSGFAWALALLDSFLAGSEWFVGVARDAAGVAGLLPVHRHPAGSGIGTPRILAPFTEIYGGRNGFLLRDGDATVLRQLVEFLGGEVPDWDVLQMQLVRESRSEQLLARVAGETGFAARMLTEQSSPILMMADDKDAWIASMKPSLRTELRRRERRLREAGELRFELFTNPADVARYWEAVLLIERQSWKHAAGTAITCRPEQDRFYRALLPHAARSGQWLSALLSLDGRPIAYRLSIASHGTALGLKTSFIDEFRKFSPASVLQWMYLQHVHAIGIRCFDFSGNAEDHKMQWTQQTYRLGTLQLFKPSLRGNLARLRGGLASIAARVRARD